MTLCLGTKGLCGNCDPGKKDGHVTAVSGEIVWTMVKAELMVNQ